MSARRKYLSIITSHVRLRLLLTLSVCLLQLFLQAKDYDIKSVDEEIEKGMAVNEPLVLDLQTGINLALAAQRRLGAAFGALQRAEINVALLETEFQWIVVPKGDVGYVGGGKAGAGATVGGGVEFSKKFQQGTRFTFFPSLMKAAHNYQSNLRSVFTQPLLRGFGKDYALAPLRGAQFGSRSASRAYYLAQIRQIIQAITDMYEVIKKMAILELDKESYERVKKFTQSTKMKTKIGLSDALDVYRAEIELKHAEDNLSQSTEVLQDAQDALRDTLALDLEQAIRVELPIEYSPVDLKEKAAIEIAQQNRIEIDQAEDQLQENRRLEKLAEKNLLPELNLVVDYTTNSRDEAFTRTWTNRRETKWGVGFTTSADVMNFGESAALDMAQINTVDSERNLEQVYDNITLEVKRTLRLLKRAKEKISLQEEQIANSRKEFHLARVKFDHGMANNFDLIQSEKNLRNAQKALVTAVIDHRIGEFRLLAVLGTLADKPGICQ